MGRGRRGWEERKQGKLQPRCKINNKRINLINKQIKIFKTETRNITTHKDESLPRTPQLPPPGKLLLAFPSLTFTSGYFASLHFIVYQEGCRRVRGQHSAQVPAESKASCHIRRPLIKSSFKLKRQQTAFILQQQLLPKFGRLTCHCCMSQAQQDLQFPCGYHLRCRERATCNYTGQVHLLQVTRQAHLLQTTRQAHFQDTGQAQFLQVRGQAQLQVTGQTQAI